MSVVVREHAPECAASRARRASGREAAIRNFSFRVAYRDAWATTKVANRFACKAFLYKTLSPFSGTFFRPAARQNAARFAHVRHRAGEQLRANRRSRFRKLSATAVER